MARKRKIPSCEHKDMPSYGLGLCRKCYMRLKYSNDPVYREKRKQITIEYQKRRAKSDSSFYRKKSERYRKKYPEKMRFFQARSLYKKLTPSYKQRFLNENGLCTKEKSKSI